MREEIGLTAGKIWHLLDARGELPLAQIKKDVKGKTLVFDCATGWLMREDTIVITPEKPSFRTQLKDTHAKTAYPA